MPHLRSPARRCGFLERGWVIANHKLVSFHAAFISSVLSLPDGVTGKLETLRFMFLSGETLISLVMFYISWHIGIAIHEMGHYLTAARLSALNPESQRKADAMAGRNPVIRWAWYLGMLARIPWGRFSGVRKDNGNYAPDSPYNLAVAAAGPVWSGVLAAVMLPAAAVCIGTGLVADSHILVYVGRFFLAPGIVGLLDRMLADRGKLREFRQRERRAAEKEALVESMASTEEWMEKVGSVRQRLLDNRMRSVPLDSGGYVSTPWQFRNCAMGGRHTEKQYPESNISMQESMFVPLSTSTYEEAQEMTVSLQYRLKEIIESAPGAKVMGIGIEGGLAPYIERDPQDRVPELRLWRMMKQAVLDCGLEPGVDVAIALDPAASELENAYRTETGQMDSVGMYRFWRDRGKVDMSRDEVLDLYRRAMEEDGIPILSIEDGFGEQDHEGWKLAMKGDPERGVKSLGERIFIVGDDLVTTKDETIELCARNGEINATLIKANQIGTLSETVLAMLTSLAYGSELIVSHRSKSPNDPFEADFAVAMNTLGLKAGGGTNTERLQKYGRVTEILSMAGMNKGEDSRNATESGNRRISKLLTTLTGRDDINAEPGVSDDDLAGLLMRALAITAINGTEEPTNAGIPSAAATVMLGGGSSLRFKGSTPLGTSAGEDEAIHYVDSIIEQNEVTLTYPDLFSEQKDGTFRFADTVDNTLVKARDDKALLALWTGANRYNGRGCMKAVDHIESVIANAFRGRELSDIEGILQIDRELLQLELSRAFDTGRLSTSATEDQRIHAMQRKAALGMNAILSVSLALGRMIAARDGMELWQLIRGIAVDAMAGFITACAPALAPECESPHSMDFEELKKMFREAARNPIDEGRDIYRLLREQLPVYSKE